MNKKFDFERDCDLRGFWVAGLSDIQESAKHEIFIPDSLLRLLYKEHFPHRTSWQEWKRYERAETERVKKFNKEVMEYKKLNLGRQLSVWSNAADIVAKSEQLAERYFNEGQNR